MQTIALQIKALAPLAFPERKPGVQFNASLLYIPGAAIYGALGERLAAQGKYNETLFRALRCHNAYPALAEDTWVRPLPVTAIQPKGTDNEAPYDSLYERVCWERQQPTALIYAPTDSDGRPWVPVGGKFYTLHTLHPTIRYRTVQQRILTRVAINRERGTAKDGLLYSPLAISEVMNDEHTNPTPTQFRGSLLIPDDENTTVIKTALARVTYLGARQTTGLGTVKIETLPLPTDAENIDTIRNRIAQMTQRFQTQAALYTRLGGKSWESDETSIFTINLLSDAILLEDGWLPTQELSAQMLKQVTDIEATLLRSFTTTKTVGGWQMMWHRPKLTHIAIAMGSLFVFQAHKPLDPAACKRLAELQRDGIGERRAEGFGQIRICDDFHVTDRGEVK